MHRVVVMSALLAMVASFVASSPIAFMQVPSASGSMCTRGGRRWGGSGVARCAAKHNPAGVHNEKSITPTSDAPFHRRSAVLLGAAAFGLVPCEATAGTAGESKGRGSAAGQDSGGKTRPFIQTGSGLKYVDVVEGVVHLGRTHHKGVHGCHVFLPHASLIDCGCPS